MCSSWASSALDLVEEGIGIAFIPERCAQPRPGIRFVSMKNWHQALYMCTMYDKWLEPLVWEFVEIIVKTLREEENPASGQGSIANEEKNSLASDAEM